MILEWGSQGIIVLPILFKILTYGLHTHTHAHTHTHTHTQTHTYKRDQHSPLLEMIQTKGAF